MIGRIKDEVNISVEWKSKWSVIKAWISISHIITSGSNHPAWYEDWLLFYFLFQFVYWHMLFIRPDSLLNNILNVVNIVTNNIIHECHQYEAFPVRESFPYPCLASE